MGSNFFVCLKFSEFYQVIVLAANYFFLTSISTCLSISFQILYFCFSKIAQPNPSTFLSFSLFLRPYFPANVHYYLLHGSKSSTDYSKDNMLGQHAPADYRRSYWLRELTVLNKDRLWVEEQKAMQEEARKEAINQKLAAEEYAKHMADPEVVSWLREGAKAAVNWCHRTPLNKEERQARLEGKKYREPEIDLKQFYYY